MKQLLAVILLCLLTVPAYGAFGAGTQWYVDGAAGANTNGGAFDSGVGSPGTDESGTATAITITTTASTTGTGSPAFSATTHGPGNFVHIASGTGCTTGWHEITSQAVGVATFESAIADMTGRTCVGTIGGPFATISTATALTVAGNTVNVKDSATYSISSALTGLAGGSAGVVTTLRGYHSTVGDAGNCAISPTGNGCPIIQATAATFTMLTLGGIDQSVRNFVFDCNSQSMSSGLNLGSNSANAFNITIKFCGATGLAMNANGGESATNIWVHGGVSCSQGVQVSYGSLINVVSESNQCPGFSLNVVGDGIVTCVFCIAANNTGATTDGFLIQTTNTQGTGLQFVNSAAYKNGRDGWRCTSTNGCMEANVKFSWFYGNVGKSINSSGGSISGNQQFNWNAYESGTLNGVNAGPNDITLTANPTVAGDSGNYALNVTAGGGLLLRGAAFPGSIGSNVGNISIGPIQPLVNSGASLGGAFGFVQ